MDLHAPEQKMSTSAASESGRAYVLDEPTSATERRASSGAPLVAIVGAQATDSFGSSEAERLVDPCGVVVFVCLHYEANQPHWPQTILAELVDEGSADAAPAMARAGFYILKASERSLPEQAGVCHQLTGVEGTEPDTTTGVH